MPRKRPKSLDSPIVVQARRLEAWAYLRCDQWKKQYRYTLVNEFRSHITEAKNEIIRAFELSNKFKKEKLYHYSKAQVELALTESNMDLMIMDEFGIMSEKDWAKAHAEQIQSTLNSYFGFLKWCNAYRLRKAICDRIRGSVLGVVLMPSEDNSKVTIRPKFTKETFYKNEYRELKHLLAA